MALFEEQEKLLGEMHYNYIQSEQAKNFQGQLLYKLNLNAADLMGFMDRTASFIRQEEDKKKDLEQIIQGVTTTNETIKIFKHIHEAMES